MPSFSILCMTTCIPNLHISLSIQSFAPENTVLPPELVDQTYFNTPWSGVRRSNLPFALEPDYASGALRYLNPDSVDYCPLCGWGSDDPGGPQDMGSGRCARDDLKNIGGYTTFVAPGLFVNRDTANQQFIWCRKPGADCSTDAAGCMARPTECYNENGTPKTGYTPIELRVAAGQTPSCTNHINVVEGYQTVQCKMHATGFGNCGTYLYAGKACCIISEIDHAYTYLLRLTRVYMYLYLSGSSSDVCAPWLNGGTMGLYREDTGEGITIPYVRHWSWGAGNSEWVYFSVDSLDETETATQIVNRVNSIFDNQGNTTHPLPLRFEVFPPGESFPGQDYNPRTLDAVTFVYVSTLSSMSCLFLPT